MLKPLKKISIVSVTLLSCMLLSTLAAGQDKAGWLNDKVTLRFQDEQMSSVLGKLSEQTGIAILYDEKLADQKVTGHYKAIKFAEAINRLFSENNKSIQVFKNEKKIIVKTFGAKRFVLAAVGAKLEAQRLDGSEKMTLTDLDEIHAQYTEYKNRIANDNELLEDGKTRGEIRATQNQQYTEYKQRIADSNRKLEDGETLGEVRAMQEQQYKEYKKRNADDNRKLEDGVTRKELRRLHKQESLNYFNKKKDETIILLDDDMRRGDIHRMQKIQYQDYQKRLRQSYKTQTENQ